MRSLTDEGHELGCGEGIVLVRTMRIVIIALSLVAITATESNGQAGACCHGPEPQWSIMTEPECQENANWYDWIEGEVCDPDPCPPPLGNCCICDEDANTAD